MHKRFVFSSIVVSVFAAISVVGAHVDSLRHAKLQRSGQIPGKYVHGTNINPRAYRSPGDRRKVVIPTGNVEALAAAKSNGAVEVADYQSFKLMTMDSTALEMAVAAESNAKQADPVAASQLAVRDDFNVLFLRAGSIDTTAGDAPGTLFGASREQSGRADTAANLKEPPSGGGLRLVQFIGPVKREWLDRLRNIGVELIAYVPSNGYLIRADAAAYAGLLELAQTTEAIGGGFVQWEGPFENVYKIHPALADAANLQQQADLTIAVQFALNSGAPHNADDIKAARQMASSVIGDAYDVLNLTNLRLRIAPNRVADLAGLATVINIEPWTPPQLLDEESSQIIAGQLTADGAHSKSPGYLAWLAAHGFGAPFNFAIDVSDSGIDRGSTDPANLHPDFLDASKQSRVLYARDYTADLDPGDVPGHGTLNLSIAGGASGTVQDSSGYSYGIGVVPFVKLGSSKIFLADGSFGLSQPYTDVISKAYGSGARISSNSWGADNNQYTIDSQEYDTRVRDADPGQAGNQETVICFAAGNGSSANTISSPSSGKNVISVGASESSRTGAVDGCGVTDAESNNAESLAVFSSRGPLLDGRIKPDLVAPGTHIEGAASQNPNFDGSGVCGSRSSSYFPDGQTLYTWSSGTSHSTPQVAGATALTRQFFLNQGIEPSAALIKALLLNTTSYMTGDGAGGDLPHNGQGWGLLDLDRAFDSTPKIFVNQSTTFTNSGQDFVFTGEIKDTTRPFRVTLAWTDAPGTSAFAPWVNDLDLEVTVNGQLYLGNNFLGQTSQPGGVPDSINNVEGVWLPAGTAGTFLVRVRATAIAGVGVPGNSSPASQDFALVVYNGERKDAPVLTLASVTLSGAAGSLAQPGAAVSMTLNVQNVAPTTLSAGSATLTSSTTGVTITGGSANFPSLGTGQSGSVQTPFSFTIDKGVACGSQIQFIVDLAGQGAVVRLPFTLNVGDVRLTNFLSDDIESGDANWTHGSAKKKKGIDTWSISTKRFHSGSHSWFSIDPPDVADSHLDTIPIQVPNNAHNAQLIFFHTFQFESDFDGGVLEISTGGDFQDLGPNIIRGGYTGTVSTFLGESQNPLAGRAAWVNGKLGAFQRVVVDLSSFAGKTVVIRFRFGSDQSGNAPGWYVDDVTLNGNVVTCSPVP